MSSFVPNKQHLREALLFCFNLKKKAAEARRLLEEAYGEYAPSKTTCEDWFKRFRSGDFNIEDKERSGRPKTIEDADLQALLDKNDMQTQDQLAQALNMTRQGHRTTWSSSPSQVGWLRSPEDDTTWALIQCWNHGSVSKRQLLKDLIKKYFFM